MIPLFKPSIGEEEINALRETFKTGWIGLGPKTAEFEKKFAEYVGAKHAIGLNSATSALDLALKAFKINSGEILMPALTFVATAHVALYNNAKPVFVDVEKDTLCMDVEDIRKKITNKTKAIIPVHYSGHPCDLDAIKEIAESKNIVVIEDAAQATGAEYKGRKIGGISDAACFSFEAKKNLTTGDGGMITFNDDALADEIKRLRWFGIDKDTWQRARSKYSWYYEVVELGYKVHMNDIQATIGLVQLNKLDRLNQKRADIFRFYNEKLQNLKGMEIPVEKDYARSAHWNYVLKAEKRDELITFLKKREIETGVHHMPVHLHPFYMNLIRRNIISKPIIPVTESIWNKIVTLPSFADLKKEDAEEVANAVVEFSKM